MTDKEKIKQLEEEIWAMRDSMEQQRIMFSDTIVEWQEKYYKAVDELQKYKKTHNGKT